MISKKGRYAIRFMIDLAEQRPDKPIPLDEIADRQNISKKHLENIARLLVAGKAVKGFDEGRDGGYRLLRNPEEYTVYEILSLTESSLCSVTCLEQDVDECPRRDNCKTLPIWQEYDKIARNYFSGITLANLVNNHSPNTEPSF